MRILAFVLLLAITWSATGQPFARNLNLPEPAETRRVSYLVALDPGDSFDLFDVEGPGCVTHIWMTIAEDNPRNIILRMYWDGEEKPSVVTPISDFFGVGFGEHEPTRPFATPCLSVTPRNGYNIYLPMPYRDSARITVTNEGDTTLSKGGGVYFQADYVAYESLPDSTPYFHAQWRRESPAQRRGQPYTIMKAKGAGFIAGVTYHVRVEDDSDAWYHGGGDYIFIDGASSPAVLKGIGGEDFFGQSWGSAEFTAPFAGSMYHEDDRLSFYRFFLESPPRFEDSVLFAFGAMENTISSVAYWYQREPHTPFTTLPPPAKRDPETPIAPGEFDLSPLPRAQAPVAVLGPFAGTIDTSTPLDGLYPMPLDKGLITNYQKPYKTDDPLTMRRGVQWESAQTDLYWLDIEALYKPKMEGPQGVAAMPNTFAYVLLRLNADAPTQAQLFVGHDDALRVWVNGENAGGLDEQAGFAGNKITLNLEKGRNEVLLKVTNTWNTNFAAWAISLNLRDKEGLTVEPFPELPSAPGTEIDNGSGVGPPAP